MSQILIELVKLANLIITETKAVACANRLGAIFETTSSQTYETAPVEAAVGEGQGRSDENEDDGIPQTVRPDGQNPCGE